MSALGGFFGGGGTETSSKSFTSGVSENTGFSELDNSSVDNTGVTVSAGKKNFGDVNVTKTDHGAVQESFKFAGRALDQASDRSNQVIGALGSIATEVKTSDEKRLQTLGITALLAVAGVIGLQQLGKAKT